MNQMQIGKFIAEERKALNYTQRELAEKLGVSDKTISKWERGNGLPEVSLMVPLCKELNITVNELLSGERLQEVNYKEKAEENMVSLIKHQEYVETYKPLIAWFFSIITAAVFFVILWESYENTELLVKISLGILMVMIDVLFAIIYKGEYVYWFSFGPNFQTAQSAGAEKRKAYAWRYFRTFLIASVCLLLFLIISSILVFPYKIDFIVFGIIIVCAGLATIPIKFE